jgi:hypothetical protein
MWIQETGMTKGVNIMTRNLTMLVLKEIQRKIRILLEVFSAGGWHVQREVVKQLNGNLGFGPKCVMVKGKLSTTSFYVSHT